MEHVPSPTLAGTQLNSLSSTELNETIEVFNNSQLNFVSALLHGTGTVHLDPNFLQCTCVPGEI